MMSEKLLRERSMVRFSGLPKYSRAVAWLVVCAHLGMALAGVAFGNYLLGLDVTWITVLLMIATAIFIGTRLRGLNNIVHECCHSTFTERREDNVTIGRFCSNLLTGCFRSYKADHLSHHSHLGDYDRDAEFAVIEKFGLHEPLTPRTILRHTITPLLGRHLPVYSRVRFSGEDGMPSMILKITLAVAMVAFTFYNPWTSLFFVLIPLFYIFPTLNFWTDCLDHAGLCGNEDGLEASRNVLAPAPIRLLFFPRNDSYHLVHHLFPQVPAQHLNRVHEELKADPLYSRQPAAVRPLHEGLKNIVSSPMAEQR